MCSIPIGRRTRKRLLRCFLRTPSPPFRTLQGFSSLLGECNSSFHDICNKCSRRIIKWLPVWFYKNQFKSGRKACRITQPTLFLSGLSDQVKCLKKYLKRKKSEISLRFLQLIPPKMMTDLYTTCGAPVKRLARWKCFFLMGLV